jgi:acyl-coenzyme A thioesterase PaaI-like protein
MMSIDMTSPALSRSQIEAFLRREFPELYVHGDLFSVLEIGAGTSRMRLAYHPTQLRPGGTISGPAMMQLADVAIWVALLGAIGEVALAVTTNFSINFLKKPEPKALIIDCSFLKIGRTLATGQGTLYSEGISEPVAHAVGTYAIPKVR